MSLFEYFDLFLDWLIYSYKKICTGSQYWYIAINIKYGILAKVLQQIKLCTKIPNKTWYKRPILKYNNSYNLDLKILVI